MITTIVTIIVIIAIVIGYLEIGLFLGCFAMDDPATPMWVGYLVAFTWPVLLPTFFVGSILWAILKMIGKFILFVFFSRYIDIDPATGKRRILHTKDIVRWKENGKTYCDFKQRIEEELSDNLKLQVTQWPEVWKAPHKLFFLDLMRYSNHRISREEMIKKHSEVCLNLEQILDWDWNIKNVPGL